MIMPLFIIHGTVGHSILDELFDFRRQRGAAGLNVVIQSFLSDARECTFKSLANASENLGSYCGPAQSEIWETGNPVFLTGVSKIEIYATCSIQWIQHSELVHCRTFYMLQIEALLPLW